MPSACRARPNLARHSEELRARRRPRPRPARGRAFGALRRRSPAGARTPRTDARPGRRARRSTARACPCRSARCLRGRCGNGRRARATSASSVSWSLPMPAPVQVAPGDEALQRRHVELEDVAVDRHRVLHAHHELHVQRAVDPAVLLHRRGLEDHRQVEGLDLGLDAVRHHLARRASRRDRAGCRRRGSGS